MSVRVINVDELRALVKFEDLIEPCAGILATASSLSRAPIRYAADLGTQQANALKKRLIEKLPNVEIRVTSDLEQTVRSTDVLITATLSREPLVRGEWLREGQHITAVGADDPTKCELDAVVLQRARVFVDSVETTVLNGDVLRAIRQGQYRPESVAGEIGEVLAGHKIGRTKSPDITVVKLVGIGAQDLAAAEYVLENLSS